MIITADSHTFLDSCRRIDALLQDVNFFNEFAMFLRLRMVVCYLGIEKIQVVAILTNLAVKSDWKIT